MWITTVVLIAVFSCCQAYGLPSLPPPEAENDRFCINAGRVHARTNALGLGVVDGKNQLLESNLSGSPNITCDANYFDKESCGNWDFGDGINWETYYDLPPVPHLSFKNWMTYETRPQTNFTIARLRKADIIFTMGTGSLKEVTVPLVIRSGLDSQIYYYCSYSNKYRFKFNVRDRNGDIIQFSCNEEQSLMVDFLDKLRVELVGGYVNIYKNDNRIFQWYYFNSYYNSKQITHFSISSTDGMEVDAINSLEYPTAFYSDENIVSPIFTPQSEKLCFVILSHCTNDCSNSSLDISIEGLLPGDLYHLSSITDIKSGWNARVFKSTLKNLNPIKLKVERFGNISIARIASCSQDGEEVTELPTVTLPSCGPLQEGQRDSLELHSTSASVVDIIQKVTNTTNYCWNGGELTTAGCACTPGFSGPNCEMGCGRNRFGQDCEGYCSFHSDKCRGLLLCTKFTGCQCAPGYHGGDCTEACGPGFYGNDCSQRCGRCSGNSTCDIYTGECVSCEEGYLAPHCKTASVYYGSRPEATSPSYSTIVVSFDPSNYISKGEPPQLYQIQIREKGNQWKVHTSKYLLKTSEDSEKEKKLSEKIEGLKSGVLYQVRVLLIDAYFQKYQGELVQIAEVLTKCDIPSTYNYNLTSTANTTAITFFWSYHAGEEKWCPLETYEVTWTEGWKRQAIFTENNNFTLSDLEPGLAIKFKVRAKTSGGFAQYSSTLKTSAVQTELPPVQNLRVESSQSTSVELSWEPPRGSEERQLLYTIFYECVDRPACSPGCQNVGEGQLTQEGSSITLSPLLPFTKYRVTVRAEGGTNSSIFVGTTKVVPTETPVVSKQKPLRTNTSVTVFWEHAPVCSGYLLGYNYQLTKESNALKIIGSGFTKDTNASFHNLTASTVYSVKVFVLTVAGWNPLAYLAININTSATVPEAVRNLTVYKRGRGMLGLRWAEPRATYGQLKSFTVTHSLGQDVVSDTVEPSFCVVWPGMYCYTIEGLRSNRRYNITVSARNSEVPEDGEPATVTGITKESTPTAPVNLTLTKSQSTSLTVQWEHPELANGVLRSFLVSIEETEKYDQESCCQFYPLVETSVKEETQKYEAEVSGLHPASTYYVSVSAKTVGLGPPQSLVAYTSPPNLPLTVLPNVDVPLVGNLNPIEISWLPQDKLPEVNNSDIYMSLIKARLVLAVLNETQPSVTSGSGISDQKLDSLLQQEIGKPFYFISEYTEDGDVHLFSDFVEDSAWGRPVLLYPGVHYQLAAIQILEYSGVYNVDIRYSQSFILDS